MLDCMLVFKTTKITSQNKKLEKLNNKLNCWRSKCCFPSTDCTYKSYNLHWVDFKNSINVCSVTQWIFGITLVNHGIKDNLLDANCETFEYNSSAQDKQHDNTLLIFCSIPYLHECQWLSKKLSKKNKNLRIKNLTWLLNCICIS